MENQFVVKKDILIQGSPSAVWDALTNPEKTKEYFFNCEVLSDWEVGSQITFKGRVFLFKKIELEGTILDIEPGRLLKYTLHNNDDYRESSFSTITDELTIENGAVRLAVTDDVGQGQGAEERYQRSVKGWDKVLKGLKELVEAESQN